MPSPRLLSCFAALLLSTSGTGFAQMPVLSPADEPVAAANYQRYCALCHGDDRQGHANDHAPSLKSPSLLSSGFPIVLAEAIAYGRPGTPMGAYLDEMGGPLQRRDIFNLVLWLQKQADVAPIPLSREPVRGDAASGAAIYRAECAQCHGANGEGGTGTALGNAAMLALSPDAFLRHAVEHGREGTPMPAFAGKLTPAQMDDVVAFLRSRASGWTAGPRPLRAPPAAADYVLNPDGGPPRFTLDNGLHVKAAELDRELKARRRLVLLDTRVTSMWQMAHIEGAVPIPYYASREQVVADLPSDGTGIVAYCECPRAAAESVVRRLREAGFANTAVLYEGIQGWVGLGYPVVSGHVDGAMPDPHAGHAH